MDSTILLLPSLPLLLPIPLLLPNLLQTTCVFTSIMFRIGKLRMLSESLNIIIRQLSRTC
jgi:hypothetical protein